MSLKVLPKYQEFYLWSFWKEGKERKHPMILLCIDEIKVENYTSGPGSELHAEVLGLLELGRSKLQETWELGFLKHCPWYLGINTDVLQMPRPLAFISCSWGSSRQAGAVSTVLLGIQSSSQDGRWAWKVRCAHFPSLFSSTLLACSYVKSKSRIIHNNNTALLLTFPLWKLYACD